MNESKGGNGGEAVVVIIFLFALFIFLLFKFGKSNSTVFNEGLSEGNKISREEVLNQLKTEQNSDIYNKYLDEILKGAEKDKINNSDTISENYKKELENKVILPEQIVSMQGEIVGDSYNEKAKYLNEFENLWGEFKKRGVFGESKIFTGQISGDGKVIPLSDYDKETILRIATDYTLWSEKILKLDTPKVYVDKNINAAKDMLNAAYILRKMVVEQDEKVYPLWIGQYTQTIFDIIANRYAK